MGRQCEDHGAQVEIYRNDNEAVKINVIDLSHAFTQMVRNDILERNAQKSRPTDPLNPRSYEFNDENVENFGLGWDEEEINSLQEKILYELQTDALRMASQLLSPPTNETVSSDDIKKYFADLRFRLRDGSLDQTPTKIGRAHV